MHLTGASAIFALKTRLKENVADGSNDFCCLIVVLGNLICRCSRHHSSVDITAGLDERVLTDVNVVLESPESI
jgi:hypothetical protein